MTKPFNFNTAKLMFDSQDHSLRELALEHYPELEKVLEPTRSMKISTEIARFNFGYFGTEIQWLNPFDSTSIFEIRNIKNELIYKAYLQTEAITIFDIEKHIDKSYSVEIKNIKNGEIKMYSIAY